MAVLDPRSDAVVIRVVYDGAPMAGKSTSVGALGRGLGSHVFTPAEVDGRTLYFDWLDYTGGLFEGHRIRCQVISVPGQATLAPRRRRLLESADAIVFVGDSSPAGLDADRGYLRGLCRVLQQLPAPPVGVVLQANKRDHPQAVPVGKIRSMLDEMGMRIGVIEAVATDGAGIREAFVFAVRLALDRVRELMRTGQLQTARPEADSAQELLNQLKQAEDGSMDFAATTLVHTRVSDVRPHSIASEALDQAVRDNAEAVVAVQSVESDGYVPSPPDEHVASGMVWPPVDGRTVLQEVAQARVELSRSPQGDWSGAANGRWQLHSAASDVYEALEEGRTVLIQSARIHATYAREKSVNRCVVLASDGRGRYRLWQITRVP
ncbi:MAG: GTP-binding protein [Steroidobacteraceae bacterium]